MFIPDNTSYRIRLFSIPDPNCLHPGSASKNLSILTPKKWFLSSRKYDPGCSSRIRMLTFYPSRIPDPGVKKGTGSRIPDPDPQHWYSVIHLSTIIRLSAHPSLYTNTSLLWCLFCYLVHGHGSILQKNMYYIM